MKQKLLAMMFALFAVQATVWTQELSGYCGDPNVNGGMDVTWELRQDEDRVDGEGNPLYMLYIEGEGAQVTEPWKPYLPYITHLFVFDGVTEVKPALFAGANYLETALLPYTISIPDSMFAASSLTYIDVEQHSIGNYAFSNCSKLSDVRIFSTVTSIGRYAFKDCKSLSFVLCFSSVPPTLEFDEYGVGPFEGIPEDAVLYVEDVEAYKASDWAKFFKIEKFVDPHGVPTIEAEDAPATPAIIHDLSGRRVTNPVKGQIYIVNGKAVVM